MADKPQQQTLSVRISETLRARLERARKLASKTGESVSTSEIAKQLLESAREDRLEVVDLLADPTTALLQIRRKGEAGIFVPASKEVRARRRARVGHARPTELRSSILLAIGSKPNSALRPRWTPKTGN